MKTLKEGIEKYKLELIFYEKDIDKFRKVIKEIQEDYSIWCEEEEEEYGGRKAVIFRIHCSTTTFAFAYYMLGVKTHREILITRDNGKPSKQRKAKIKS